MIDDVGLPRCFMSRLRPWPSPTSARAPDRAEDFFHERRRACRRPSFGRHRSRLARRSAAQPRVPAVLPRGRRLGARRHGSVAGRLFGGDHHPDRLLAGRLARARNDLRLRRRGRRGLPADGDSQLDRTPAGGGRAPRRARRVVGRRQDRRVRLGDRSAGRPLRQSTPGSWSSSPPSSRERLSPAGTGGT